MNMTTCYYNLVASWWNTSKESAPKLDKIWFNWYRSLKTEQ